MMRSNLTVRSIAENAVIAALYFVFTVAITPLAYGQFNFRLSELLVLLCFWRPDFVIGISVGCFLSNIGSSLGPFDMLFGTLATFVSCVLVAFSPKLLIGAIWPIAVNAFTVGAELYFILGLPFWINVAYVGIGEGIVILFSYLIMMLFWRRKNFVLAIRPLRKEEPSW